MNIISLAGLRRAIRSEASPERATTNDRFFKTGVGEYGHGDVFVGLTVPQCRAIAAHFRGLAPGDIERTLHSKTHEERLIGLLLLADAFERADDGAKKKIFDLYIKNADRANNWDLVDLSAPKIAGEFLLERPTAPLDRLARSKSLWRRRIAIVATYAFIRRGRLGETFRIADALLADEHDLIHKATGWMLREAGKRDKAALVAWLKPRYRRMPRTMLRYAIERFPERERTAYLRGTA